MDVTKQFYKDTREHYFLELIFVLMRSEFHPIMLEPLTNMWIIFIPKTKQLDMIGDCFIYIYQALPGKVWPSINNKDYIWETTHYKFIMEHIAAYNLIKPPTLKKKNTIFNLNFSLIFSFK